MAINKVVYGANTLIDLTGDTVTADTLKTGFTAHDKSGTAITGTLDLAEGSVYQDEDGCVVLNDDDGSGVSYIPLTVSSNGTYTASSSYCYNPVTVNVDAQYYSIYKSLAFRSVITSSATGVSEWANSLSIINEGQFANQCFSGSFAFNNVTRIGTYAFGSAYGNTDTGYQRSFTTYFPNVTSVSAGAFVRNFGIRSIDCPTCKYIGNAAFFTCKYLLEVNFPVCLSLEFSAFGYCTSLPSVSFPSCVSIGQMAFDCCYSLLTVSFPVCESIGNFAFRSCRSLKEVSFPACNFIGNYAFASCSSLSNAYFQVLSQVESYAFISCSSLRDISFPSCTIVRDHAFQYCSSLTNISFPSCTIVGSHAFGSCSALLSAIFPNCEMISSSAFINCRSLAVISFPKCTSIIGAAFSSCYALESAYFLGSSVPSLGTTYAFSSTPLILSSYLGHFGSIFVRQSLLESFLSVANWNAYSSRFVGLTDEQIAALNAS